MEWWSRPSEPGPHCLWQFRDQHQKPMALAAGHHSGPEHEGANSPGASFASSPVFGVFSGLISPPLTAPPLIFGSVFLCGENVAHFPDVPSPRSTRPPGLFSHWLCVQTVAGRVPSRRRSALCVAPPSSAPHTPETRLLPARQATVLGGLCFYGGFQDITISFFVFCNKKGRIADNCHQFVRRIFSEVRMILPCHTSLTLPVPAGLLAIWSLVPLGFQGRPEPWRTPTAFRSPHSGATEGATHKAFTLTPASLNRHHVLSAFIL